jgi:ArsR family transcriptional regulator
MSPVATSSLARSAQLFHALSDEARLEIIQILLDGEHCVCDLMTHIDAAQSRLSYHLKVLKDAGLVTDRREGRWSYYTLQRDAFVEAEGLLGDLRPRQGRAPHATCC